MQLVSGVMCGGCVVCNVVDKWLLTPYILLFVSIYSNFSGFYLFHFCLYSHSYFLLSVFHFSPLLTLTTINFHLLSSTNNHSPNLFYSPSPTATHLHSPIPIRTINHNHTSHQQRLQGLQAVGAECREQRRCGRVEGFLPQGRSVP